METNADYFKKPILLILYLSLTLLIGCHNEKIILNIDKNEIILNNSKYKISKLSIHLNYMTIPEEYIVNSKVVKLGDYIFKNKKINLKILQKEYNDVLLIVYLTDEFKTDYRVLLNNENITNETIDLIEYK